MPGRSRSAEDSGGKLSHFVPFAFGLFAAWLAEVPDSNASYAVIALGAAIAFLSFRRRSAPSRATIALWALLALCAVPAAAARFFPMLRPMLPGFGSSYPPTRFLLVLGSAALFAGFRRWTPEPFRAWHFGLALLWITLCAARSYELYRRLVYGYDLAHVLNLLDNTLDGRFLYSDYIGATILSHHLFLTLPLLAPLYYFLHSPFLPQAAQIAMMGASALLLPWSLSRRYGRDAGVAAFFTFLMHPAFQGQILHEFDPGVIGLFALTLAIAGYCEDWSALFWIGWIGAILSKEHFAVAACVTGVVMMRAGEDGDRAHGKLLAVIGGSVLAGFVVFSFFGERSFNLGTQITLRTGGSALGTLVEPLRPSKIGYLVHMFLPNGGLALLAWPLILPALPELALNVVSRFPMNQLSSHYATVSLPMLAFATAVAVHRCAAKDGELGRWAVKYAIAASVGAAVFSNIGPISQSLAFYDVLTTERDWEVRYLDNMIARLPQGTVAVRGSNRLLIYFPRRRPAIDLPYLDTTKQMESKDLLILDGHSGEPPEGYRLIESEGSTYVYEKEK